LCAGDPAGDAEPGVNAEDLDDDWGMDADEENKDS
jgi:hypothetical protein